MPEARSQPEAPAPTRAPRRARGLLDTSVVLAIDDIDPELLPDEPAISAITLAELAAGPQASADPDERARRQERLQRVEATFDPLPFDAGAARAYGRIYAAVAAAGRKARGQRAVDLLIAATALGEGLPLYTSNPDDFAALEGVIEVVSLSPRPLDDLGIDVECIIKAGGGSILTTIARCVPALRDGPEAFERALLEALGPGQVDLVTRVMRCF